MSRSHESLDRRDLQLLHEALTYLAKRSFQPADAVRIHGLQERVEDLLLDAEAGPSSLRLSPPEQDVLARAIPVYCDALTQRGGSLQGSAEAERLRWIVRRIAPAPGAWWRKLLGRSGR